MWIPGYGAAGWLPTQKKRKKGDEGLTAESAELGGGGGVTAGGAQAEVVPPVRLRRCAWLPVAAAARHPALCAEPPRRQRRLVLLLDSAEGIGEGRQRGALGGGGGGATEGGVGGCAAEACGPEPEKGREGPSRRGVWMLWARLVPRPPNNRTRFWQEKTINQ